MPDYNLAGLSPRTFEHLAQAIAIREIASGVRPFGAGPDGGREATFEGRMQYPSATAPWDGYLILQAKFKETPTGDRRRDGAWLIGQINAELKKYRSPKRALRRPDYLVVVTNVVLSAAAESGTKDRVLAVLEKAKIEFGFRDYDVWDYDKLRTFLDNHESIRRAYAGFTSTGDVLDEMAAGFAERRQNVADAISLFLQSELRNDEFARLEQAGDAGQVRTPLAEVFVDLPYTLPSAAAQPDVESQRAGYIVDHLLKIGAMLLKPSVIAAEQEAVLSRGVAAERGRFVIIGGPGQGKSTVGQYACQLYRAALLRGRPSTSLGHEAAQALRHFTGHCGESGQSLPSTRRFPVRVVLDRFASELVKHPELSLLDYVRTMVERGSGRQIRTDDLREWLATSPWFVVLDGLDEVPAASNRAVVLEKVVQFSSEVAVSDADVLIVATTRPQGYSDEFAPKVYEHLHLKPLSAEEALVYAARLVAIRYASSAERRATVMERLRVATAETASTRLMRSPLQVTIMAALVDRIGKPPQQRWDLFEQYYRVIYQRELERDIPTSRILRDRQRDVTTIHARVGLALQTESESAGRTEARLTRDRFLSMVEAPIRAAGFDGDELKSRAQEIVTAAANRLVFLVGLEEDRIGFEIRSLQEFMAAEALMDGKDADVERRLTAIAPYSHWRNVFLFAVGRCFANRDYLSDTVLRICLQLNDPEADQLAGTVLAGSQLALDILDEGVTREYPNYARSFAQQAIRLLELADPEPTQRLASVYADTLALTYRAAIERQLFRAQGSDRRAAWHLLFQLADRGVTWAEQLIEQHWESDPNNAWDAISDALLTVRGPVSKRLAVVVLPRVAPSHATARQRFTTDHGKLLDAPPVWFKSAWALVSGLPSGAMHLRIAVLPDQAVPDMTERGSDHLALLVTPCTDETWAGLVALESEPVLHDAWMPLLAVARFAQAPSTDTLAHAVRAVMALHPSGRVPHLYGFPWPITACLAQVRSGDDVASVEALAASGVFGTPDDWFRAEARWAARGVSVDDIVYTAEHGSLDARIADIGGPVSSQSVAMSRGTRRENTSELLRLFSLLPPGGVRSRIASMTLFSLSPRFRPSKPGTIDQVTISATGFRELVQDSADQWWTLDALGGLQLPNPLDAEWRTLCDEIGRTARPFAYAEPQDGVAESAWLAFAHDPSAVGLLSVVGHYGRPDRPVLAPTAARDACIAACAHENRAVRYGAAITLLWGRHWSTANAGAFATAVREDVAAHPLGRSALWNGLTRSNLGLEAQTALLLSSREAVYSSVPDMAGEFDEILQLLQNARRSPLHTAAEWSRLALPDLGAARVDASNARTAEHQAPGPVATNAMM